jgi:hypothetical protein
MKPTVGDLVTMRAYSGDPFVDRVYFGLILSEVKRKQYTHLTFYTLLTSDGTTNEVPLPDYQIFTRVKIL